MDDEIKELLRSIDNHIQAGFVAAVTVARQIRDGAAKIDPPYDSDISESIELIRRASESLRTSAFEVVSGGQHGS